MRQAVCAAWLCLLAGTATATDYRAHAHDYRDYLRRLQIGDHLLLAPGDYQQGLPLRSLSGEASQPIVIEANRVSHTLGYNLQIKHQTNRLPGHADRNDTLIRYKVFSRQAALPGPQARPTVLPGHFPLTGAAARIALWSTAISFCTMPAKRYFRRGDAWRYTTMCSSTPAAMRAMSSRTMTCRAIW